MEKFISSIVLVNSNRGLTKAPIYDIMLVQQTKEIKNMDIIKIYNNNCEVLEKVFQDAKSADDFESILDFIGNVTYERFHNGERI